MIIIYNLSGFVIGALSLLLGMVMVVMSGWLSLGALTIAITWIVLGFWWRGKGMPGGLKRPFPSLFFIPLPYLGIPLALLSFAMFFVEKREGGRPIDPLAAIFQSDEQMLNGVQFGGDALLSEKVYGALTSAATDPVEAKNYRVFTRTKPDAVLVLIKAPDLKRYKDPDRVRLLRAVEETLAADDELKGKQAYIGIKGRLAFGAVRTPPDSIKTGAVLNDSLLYGFYGDEQASRPPAEGIHPGPAFEKDQEGDPVD